jgi:hypothetical protein
MPLPSPRLSGDNKESEKEFISRCAGNPQMNKDFPETKQRVAVCYSVYKQAVKKKRAKGSTEEPTWEEVQAEISAAGLIECDGEIKIINLPVPESK